MKNTKSKVIIIAAAAIIVIAALAVIAVKVLKDTGSEPEPVQVPVKIKTAAAAKPDRDTAAVEPGRDTAAVETERDTADGVNIIYQTVDPDPSETDMADTIYKLQKRARNWSAEAEVYRVGKTRIYVHIPGVFDENEVLKDLGRPGSLSFIDPEGNTVLDGLMIASAQAGVTEDSMGNKDYIVSLVFTAEGTEAFADATAKWIDDRIYIVYDDEIISAPTVREPITDGQCQIDHIGGYEEAEMLASYIRIGSLPLELKKI